MTITHKFLAATMMLVASVASASAFAEDYSHSTPGISGYDPVSYFADGKAVRGSGFHVTVVDGVPYAFATAEHQKLFEAPPPRTICRPMGAPAPRVLVSERNSWRTLRSGELSRGNST